MNVAQMTAWVEKNKVPVLGVAGAGVVALGLRAKNAKKGDAGRAPAAATAIDTAGASAYGGGQAIAGTVPYNSSSSDAYNSLMPAIERLYDLQAEKGDNSPIPVPTFDPGYYRVTGAPTIYRVDDQGNRDWLSWTEATALGFSVDNNNGLNLASKDDVRWKQTKLIGEDGTPSWDTKIA